MSLHVSDIKGTITSFLVEVGLADPEKVVANEAHPPLLTREQELLVQCYRSGQIDADQWRIHLEEDPALAAYFASGVTH
ncbi:hypothetical protein CYG48_10190 [Neorhizobium sp. SOG26]|uniref:Uncharacterized protein n=1 Tax=Neorhizobium turbinariae TaxID=2937795 RepID=A0ABT0IWE4_9HYPH|nr:MULTISPECIES: hypothetical protein [Neorhizobium]AXV16028.1 hypothetical protein CYG48_10190 [Neorhizobium sp. SOG26]MCK8782165.1 hypothetical protein [Neorhizobium turbinariae]